VTSAEIREKSFTNTLRKPIKWPSGGGNREKKEKRWHETKWANKKGGSGGTRKGVTNYERRGKGHGKEKWTFSGPKMRDFTNRPRVATFTGNKEVHRKKEEKKRCGKQMWGGRKGSTNSVGNETLRKKAGKKKDCRRGKREKTTHRAKASTRGRKRGSGNDLGKKAKGKKKKRKKKSNMGGRGEKNLGKRKKKKKVRADKASDQRRSRGGMEEKKESRKKTPRGEQDLCLVKEVNKVGGGKARWNRKDDLDLNKGARKAWGGDSGMISGNPCLLRGNQNGKGDCRGRKGKKIRKALIKVTGVYQKRRNNQRGRGSEWNKRGMRGESLVNSNHKKGKRRRGKKSLVKMGDTQGW